MPKAVEATGFLLFLTHRQLQIGNLGYILRFHHDPGTAAIRLKKEVRAVVNTGYTFLWNNNWYLTETVDASYK